MGVADAKGRRWDAAAGIGFAVFAVVALALPGTPPKGDDSTVKIAVFMIHHRKDILIGNFLLGVGAIFFLWFIGTLRSYLRSGEGGEGRLSAAAFGGGIAGIVLLLAGAAVVNAVSFDLATHPPVAGQLVRAVFDASGALFGMGSLAFAAFFAATACSGARSGALPPWAYWSASVIAVVQVLGGVSLFATSGVFVSGGAFSAFIAPGLALVWIVAVSVVMMNRDAVPPVARTQP